jgi:hypothetical protein
LDYGYGNVGEGNPLNDDFLQGHGVLGLSGADEGWSLVSKIDDPDAPYPYDIDSLDWGGYSHLALFFKVGGGQYCPVGLVCNGNPDQRTGSNQPGFDWFVFELPFGETAASFEVINNEAGGGGFSHWGLYGIRGNNVPIPGTLWLFGIALAGLGFARRRKLH